jgi:thioredoxin reductase/Pyruvate/2-oxoacid:ferredoxin oxidoreductase delta subunit
MDSLLLFVISESLLVFLITAVVTLFFIGQYLIKLRQTARRARVSAQKGQLFSEGPKGMHPHIDASHCIGCGGCTEVCPEGDVLAMLAGQAVIVNGHKCIGHSLCAEACPVGAITMVMDSPSMGADLPYLTQEYETNVSNLFIVGELGGLGLIKNAVNQGRDCIDTIANRLANLGRIAPTDDSVFDVVIVGAGPAGISASLRAIERGLTYITLERDEVGGTVAKYPKQKLVMTSPVQFPMYGKFKKMQLSKENLLSFWSTVLNRVDFNVSTCDKVENITWRSDGVFVVSTAAHQCHARAVVLALGRAGEPRKLGVKGENLPKVMYRLIEADHYTDQRILVVGGGDSAVEAAMGLAHQEGNSVTLSYRQQSFGRIKERNAKRIDEHMREGKINVIFNSNPVEFLPDRVILDVHGQRLEIANDFVWIFAGGLPPNDFLRKIGISFGMQDTTQRASRESRQAQAEKQRAAVLTGR